MGNLNIDAGCGPDFTPAEPGNESLQRLGTQIIVQSAQQPGEITLLQHPRPCSLQH